MRETVMVVGLLLGLGAIGAAQAVPWSTLLELGYTLMLEAARIGVPAELIYFAALGLCLHLNGAAARGWYWRSFEHHDRLTPAQRIWVLPIFYLGALAFLAIVLGIGLVLLAVIAALVKLTH